MTAVTLKPDERALRQMELKLSDGSQFGMCLKCLRISPIYRRKDFTYEGTFWVDQQQVVELERKKTLIIQLGNQNAFKASKLVEASYLCMICKKLSPAALMRQTQRDVTFYKLSFASNPTGLPELLLENLASRIKEVFLKNSDGVGEETFGGTLYKGCVKRGKHAFVMSSNWPGIWPQPLKGSRPAIEDYAKAAKQVLDTVIQPPIVVVEQWNGAILEVSKPESLLTIVNSANTKLYNVAISALEVEQDAIRAASNGRPGFFSFSWLKRAHAAS